MIGFVATWTTFLLLASWVILSPLLAFQIAQHPFDKALDEVLWEPKWPEGRDAA